MDYQMQEGRLTLPDTLQDRTVNMFVLGATIPAPLSVTISRDSSLQDEAINDYMKRQIKLLTSKLRGYSVLETKLVMLSTSRPVQGVQMEACSQVDGRPIFQRQAAFIIAPQRVLVFAASAQRDFTAEQASLWDEMLASFEPSVPALAQE
jgi:hypothetical protein